MKRKILLILLTVAGLWSAKVSAQDFEYLYEGVLLKYTVKSETARTCITKTGTLQAPGNREISGDLKLPEEVIDENTGKTYKLIGIGECSFTNNTLLTSVTFPNTVTEIGASAFEKCDQLEEVTLPPSLEYIGDQAFYNTSSLKINIPRAVKEIGAFAFRGNTTITTPDITLRTSKIGNGAFYNCRGLQKVNINGAIKELGKEAFKNCQDLKSFIIKDSTPIPDGLLSGCKSLETVTLYFTDKIGNGAFSDCSSLKEISLPDALSEISNSAFIGCSSLTKINFPPALSSISNRAFSYTGLTSVTIPATVDSIGTEAFAYCSNLDKVSICNGVKSIGQAAFITSKISEIALPPSVETIGGYAFAGNTNLKSVIMGYGIKSIGQKAFDESPVSYIAITAPTPPAASDDAFSDYSAKLYLQDPGDNSTIDAYHKAGSCWGRFESSALTFPEKIEGNIENIPPKAGENVQLSVSFSPENTSLKNILWSSTNTKVATVNESGVVSVLTSCGSCEIIAETFYYNGPKATFPLSVTQTDIKPTGISFSRKFADITEGNSIQTYAIITPENAFDKSITWKSNDTNIATVNDQGLVTGIKEGETTIIARTVNGLEASFKITVKKEHIFSYEYNGDTVNYVVISEDARTCITAPGTIKKAANIMEGGISLPQEPKDGDKSYVLIGIGDFSFSGVTNILMPNTVKEIGEGAFYFSRELNNIELSTSLKKIGERAFYLCSYLGQTQLPSSLTHIGDQAFYGCNYLVVNIPRGLKEIGKGAFQRIDHINTPDITLNATLIGDGAFSGCRGLEAVTLRAPLDSLGNGVFSYCPDLLRATIEGNIRELPNNTFSGCANLESVAINSRILKIGISAFESCPALKRLKIPTSITEIGIRAFINCKSLTKVGISNSITTIGNMAFAACSGLTSLNFGTGVKTIGEYAFADTQLSEIVIPPSVETIGSSAFLNVESLKTIVMGQNVRSIGEKAFSGTNPTSVSITAQTPPTAPDDVFSDYSGQLNLQDPGNNSVIEAYRNAPACWKNFKIEPLITPEKIEGNIDNIAAQPGESVQLEAKVYPENVTLKEVFWRSTNPDIATVDNNGTVTIVAENKVETRALISCDIIAETLYANGPVATIPVTVTIPDVEATGITINTTVANLKKDETLKLEVSILPGNSTDKSVTWSSSDPDVATVDDMGVVTAVNSGMTTITAETSNGLSAVCKVFVEVKSGIDNIDGNSGINVTVRNGVIFIEAPNGTQTEVYSRAGTRIAKTSENTIGNLDHGLYIVRVNGKSFKVIL